jgi:pSer/pThr/pTyr-binding forkhead associated (FHA) protein
MDRVFEIRAVVKGSKAISVGRTADSDVMINDFSVSRKQCTFTQQGPSTWMLADAGSTNGTVVGGKKYKAPATVLLNGGEEIIVGRLAFEFHSPLTLVAKIKAAG